MAGPDTLFETLPFFLREDTSPGINSLYALHRSLTVIVAFTFAIALWYYLYHKVTSSNRLRPFRRVCPDHAGNG